MRGRVNVKAVYPVFLAFFALAGICMYMYIARGQFVYDGDRALYSDDMIEHKIMTNPDTSTWEKITDTSSNKVRYITNIALVIFWKIVGTNYEREDAVLLMVNFALMMTVWCAVFLITKTDNDDNKIKRIALATGGAIIFASSRFAYYSYEEIFGIMENMGTALTVIFVTLLILDEFKFTKTYWLANVIWICDIYVHERYLVLGMVLLVYSVLAAIYNRDKLITPKTVMRVLFIIMLLVITFGYRIFLFGNRAVDGTGGTSITDTFTIYSLLKMMAKELLYLVGVNVPGDAYLNGIDPKNVKLWVYVLTVLIWLFACLTIFLYAKKIKSNKKDWCKIAIFFTTIACLVLASSVTIRVEMRWIYASFAVEIIAIIYMLAHVMENSSQEIRMSMRCIGITSVLAIIMIENFYSSYWNMIYNWGMRQDMSALSDEFDKYSQIENLYIVTGSTLSDGDIYGLAEAEGLILNNLIQLDDVKSIDYVGEDDVVLLKDDDKIDYYDLTESYKSIIDKTGRYEDGWCEPYTDFTVYSSGSQSLYLQFYLPDYDLIGEGNNITILINGEVKGIQAVTKDSLTEIAVEGLLQGGNNVELMADFYVVEDSGRSEDGRLSYVLSDIFVE